MLFVFVTAKALVQYNHSTSIELQADPDRDISLECCSALVMYALQSTCGCSWFLRALGKHAFMSALSEAIELLEL